MKKVSAMLLAVALAFAPLAVTAQRYGPQWNDTPASFQGGKKAVGYQQGIQMGKGDVTAGMKNQAARHEAMSETQYQGQDRADFKEGFMAGYQLSWDHYTAIRNGHPGK